MSANEKADLQIQSGNFGLVLPPQPVDATHALNLSAGVSNSNVLRGRSLNTSPVAILLPRLVSGFIRPLQVGLTDLLQQPGLGVVSLQGQKKHNPLNRPEHSHPTYGVGGGAHQPEGRMTI